MAATPAHAPSREAGLSLIEILVGISILAIVAFAVTLSITPGGPAIEREADRLAARLNQAEAEAIASGAPVGLAVEGAGEGYAFYRLVDGRWWPVRDHPTLTEYRFEDALRLRVEETRPVAPEAAARAALYPAIWFDPAGMTEPFRLRLSADDGAEIELDWQAAGRIERTARG